MIFIEKPRGDSPDELYNWALELCEKLNRELNNQKKEDTQIGDNNKKA